MHTLKTTTIVSAALLSLLLSACGGSGSPMSNEGGGTNSGNTNTTNPVAIGIGSGSNFTAGKIGADIGTSTLAAGGTTKLTVNIVSSSNTLVTTASTVTFNSRCYASQEATLSDGNLATNRIFTENGQATITYSAKGCVDDDEITATTQIDGTAKVARITIKVAQDSVQSISFDSAAPSKIYLKNSGSDQTSTVRFLVKGSTGAPVKNIPLKFSLSTQIGGVSLTKTDATTDSQGYASTDVQAGTIPTAVEVIATDPKSGITGRSNKLSIGTGIPDQNSTSLSASLFNPPAWEYDGEEVGLTIRLADAFNNPPPDGTSVQFVAEGGAIDPNCTTQNGVCSVKWRSQQPRPSNGRVTILATTVGNESFQDNDGDGLYDLGVDTFSTFNNGGDCDPNVPLSTSAAAPGSEPCDDLGEAYLDKNEDGKYQIGEYITDFNINRKYDTENGIYNGVLCATEGSGCTKSPVSIREEIILVMSSEKPMTENGRLLGQPESIELGANETFSFNVTLADINGNSMPAGTKVSLNTSTASDVTINQSMTNSVASTRSPTSFNVTLKASETKRPTGNFSIVVTSPKGIAYSFSTRLIQKPEENTAARYIGKGLGQTFLAGHIDVAIGDAALPPYGSTNLSVNFVDTNNTLTAGNAQVAFTSPCFRAGTATFTDASGNENNVVSTQTGRATILYTDKGCLNSDEVVATANLPGLLISTANTILKITEQTAQNITFDKAEPAQIGLKGSGGIELSRVTFKVNGPTGSPLAGVPVTLTLNNNVGGVCLSNVSPCAQTVTLNSDASGIVTALVQSGTIATTVRVTATAKDSRAETIATQSSRLVISTGIPDQDSMSLAASEYNPPSYINGYEVDVSVRMADAFNNPVPEGTTVNFTASGGLIQDSCETNALSSCTVKWIAQSPKPANGKVTILATALGNESFIDRNGNGQYDNTDSFATNGSTCNKNSPTPSLVDSATACDDLGEAYLDSNQNGTYDLADGYFVDIFSAGGILGKDGLRTPGNGLYDGALCSTGASCTKNSVTVRDDITIVLSTGIPGTVDNRLPGQPGIVSLALNGETTISVTLQDTNGNSMPAGTEVTIDDTDASNVSIIMNPEPVTVPSNATNPLSFSLFLKADSALAASGRFRIQVKTPDKGGVIGTTRSYTTRIN